MMETKNIPSAYRFRPVLKRYLILGMAILASICYAAMVREDPRALFKNYFDNPIRYPYHPDDPIKWYVISPDTMQHS